MTETSTFKVLIISDTHACTTRIDQVVEQAGHYDLLLHAGDHAEDVLGNYPNAITVCGNCDPEGIANVEQDLDILGIKGLLTHGHTLNVKTSALPIFYRAREKDAKLIVFGHTHTPTLFVEQGRVFLNPGSLHVPRGYTECTYAVLELQKDESGTTGTFTFYTLEGKHIPAFDLVHKF